MILASFLFFLTLISAVGVAAVRKSKKTSDDYILASRSVGPIATALSAVSTCHSGFMFIGLIGFTYQFGISSLWLIVAWILGDIFAWYVVYPKLRAETGRLNVNTLVGFVTHGIAGTGLRKVVAAFTFVFLAVYAAAQLHAGSKALFVMMDWPYWVGIVLGAIIVTLYSFSGGVRASIWTDVVQSIIMFGSMLGLSFVSLVAVGGVGALFSELATLDPSLVSLIPETEFGFPLYLAGWIAFGFGVIGQPHIASRPMSIKASDLLNTASVYYLIWYAIFSIGAITIGLSARLLLPELSGGDVELALPILARELLPSLFVGGILAGIFSATISTADSQVITCSASITQDLFPKWRKSFVAAKVFTILTMCLATVIALLGSKSVFLLVILAWSSCAVVLGVPVLIKLFGKTQTPKSLGAMMCVGFLIVVLWVSVLDASGGVNEVLPAAIGMGLVYMMFNWRRRHG